MKKKFTLLLVMLFVLSMAGTEALAQKHKKKHPRKMHKSEVIAYRPVKPAVRVHNNYRPYKHVNFRRGHMWIEGHWVFNRRTRSYIWVEGKYVRKHKQKVWVDGYWVRVKRGWKYVPGYWA